MIKLRSTIELRTSILIEAPVQNVWRLLSDLQGMGSWNPYILKAEGNLKEGESLEITACPPRSYCRTFQPIIIKVNPPFELRWVWSPTVPCVFRGEHIFELSTQGPKKCVFVHRELFSGLFMWFHRIFRYDDTRRGFIAFNNALKLIAEGTNP